MDDLKFKFDVIADLNAEDDDGLGWSTLSDACDTDRVRSGAMLLARNESAKAVVRVVVADDDGQIHLNRPDQLHRSSCLARINLRR